MIAALDRLRFAEAIVVERDAEDPIRLNVLVPADGSWVFPAWATCSKSAQGSRQMTRMPEKSCC
jgi:hypothetical protein